MGRPAEHQDDVAEALFVELKKLVEKCSEKRRLDGANLDKDSGYYRGALTDAGKELGFTQGAQQQVRSALQRQRVGSTLGEMILAYLGTTMDEFIAREGLSAGPVLAQVATVAVGIGLGAELSVDDLHAAVDELGIRPTKKQIETKLRALAKSSVRTTTTTTGASSASNEDRDRDGRGRPMSSRGAAGDDGARRPPPAKPGNRA